MVDTQRANGRSSGRPSSDPLRIPLPHPPPRVAVLGIGNELNGDDAAGVLAARTLAARTEPREDLLIVEAGVAPENFTGTLRRFRPDLVLEIDAAEMGKAPGAAVWLDWRETDGLSASTHTLPPSVLASFLASDLGCQVALIGIQPAETGLGIPVSPAVTGGILQVVAELARWLAVRPRAS